MSSSFNCRAARGQSERRAPRLRPERQREHRLDSVTDLSGEFYTPGALNARRTDSSFAKQTRRYETFAVSWARAHNLPLKVRKYRTFVRTEVLSYNNTSGSITLSSFELLRRYATTFVRYLYTYTYVYCTCTSGNRMTYWYYETFAVSWARAHNLPLKVRKYRTFVRTEVLSYEGTIILPEVLHYLRSNSFEGTFESTCTFVPSNVRNYDICTRTRVLYTYVYSRKQNDILISYLRTKVRRGQGL